MATMASTFSAKESSRPWGLEVVKAGVDGLSLSVGSGGFSRFHAVLRFLLCMASIVVVFARDAAGGFGCGCSTMVGKIKGLQRGSVAPWVGGGVGG